MKLVVAVVQADAVSGVTSQLSHRGFRSTRIQTVGGFLRTANATILVGVEDDDVETVVNVISAACAGRRDRAPNATPAAPILPSHPAHAGGATVFVVNVSRFERV